MLPVGQVMVAVSGVNWQTVVATVGETPPAIVGGAGVGLTVTFSNSGVKLLQPVVPLWQIIVYWKVPVIVFRIVKLLGFATPLMIWLPPNTAEPLTCPPAPGCEPGVAALQPSTVRLIGEFWHTV